MRSQSHVSLRIIEIDCLPEEIIRDTGITPSRTWHKGDTRAKTGQIEKNSGWGA